MNKSVKDLSFIGQNNNSNPDKLVKIESSELELNKDWDQFGLTSHVFFGKYKGLPIAVKRFKDKKTLPQQTHDTDPTVEANIHHMAQHDYVVKLYGYVQDSAYNGLVMEHCTKGSLFDFLNTTIVDSTKPDRERYINHIAQALAYIHHVCNIIHLDIKPENILRIVKNGETIAQLTDFGLSALLENGEKEFIATSAWGSPNYAAPEFVKPHGEERSITCAADMFSFGVLLKAVIASNLSNVFPDTGNPVQMLRLTREGVHEHTLLPDDTHTTAAFYVMLKSLLRTDPNQRMSSKDFVAELNSGTRVFKHG